MISDKPMMKTVRASGTWSAPMKIESKAGDHSGIVMDQPAETGGTGKGPNPMELLLASLVGCEAQTLVLVAQEMDFKFSGFSAEFEGDMDLRGFFGAEGICRYYCGLRGTITVETDESQERLELIQSQVESRCPVHNLLATAGVPMNIAWRKAGTLPASA